MNDTPLDKRLIPIIAKNVTVDESKITANACLVDHLGADSLDVVELIMAVEEEFGLEISDADMEQMSTPGDIARYLLDRVEGSYLSGDFVVDDENLFS